MLVLLSTRFTVGGRLFTVPGANMMRTTTSMAAKTAKSPLTTASEVPLRRTLLTSSAVSEGLLPTQPVAWGSQHMSLIQSRSLASYCLAIAFEPQALHGRQFRTACIPEHAHIVVRRGAGLGNHRC